MPEQHNQPTNQPAGYGAFTACSMLWIGYNNPVTANDKLDKSSLQYSMVLAYTYNYDNFTIMYRHTVYRVYY